MTDLEIQAQLALPVTFPDPVPAQSPIPPVPDAVGGDTAVSDVIHHFRAEQARAERGRVSVTDRIRRLRELAGRVLQGVVHGVLPPEALVEAPLPRISVVIPALDGADTALTALSALIDQRYPDLELILVTRAGTPHLGSRLRDLGAPVILLEIAADQGLAQAVALGLARATGEVLAWHDANGLSLPGTLARVGVHFRPGSRHAVLSVDLVRTIQGWRFAAEPALDHQSMFFSRLAYDVTGGLDPAISNIASTQEIERALFVPLTQRYRWHRLAVHGAVGDGAAVAENDEAISPPSARTPVFWFPPPAPDAMPVREATPPISIAPCPVTGKLPDRYLFSSPDTRFGTPGLHDLWYVTETHCAVIAPIVARTEVRRFAAQQPPLAERRIIEPAADAPSPWRNESFGAPLLSFAFAHPLPGWLLDRWPFKRLIGWTDRTGQELGHAAKGFLPKPNKGVMPEIRMLEIGCHTGDVLDDGQRRGWKTFGTEFNVAAAEAARAKGHTIWVGAPDDILQTIAAEERFDIVFLGHVVERQADPLALVQRAARLLKPTGILVIATANLDSAQIKLFGPTWAHWHPPFHRVILSRRTLRSMALASGLKLRRCVSWSHPYWTWLSARLNETGLAGIVPNGIAPESKSRAAVETLIVATRLLNDWRGRGDYLYAVMSPDLGR